MIRPLEDIFRKTLGSKTVSSAAFETEITFASAKLTARKMPAPLRPLSFKNSRRENPWLMVFVVGEVPDMERLAFVFFVFKLVSDFQFIVMLF